MEIIYWPELKNYPYSRRDPNQRLEKIFDTASLANDAPGIEHLKILYTEKYIQRVKTICDLKQVIAEIPGSPELYKCAVDSASVAIQAAVNQSFALTRPAGHHADLEYPSGFCLFNNVAVAVEYLLSNNMAKKVCIIDIDWHHGNGTEKIFSHNDNVFMLSFCQERAYPYDTGNSAIKNKRRNGLSIKQELNVHTNDAQFLTALDEHLPAIKEFGADYIAVSAWFDAYKDDDLLALSLTDVWYYQIGKVIKWLDTKTFSVLEGGYHRDLEKCILAFVSWYNS